jgi:hypothetical protein
VFIHVVVLVRPVTARIGAGAESADRGYLGPFRRTPALACAPNFARAVLP